MSQNQQTPMEQDILLYTNTQLLTVKINAIF